MIGLNVKRQEAWVSLTEKDKWTSLFIREAANRDEVKEALEKGPKCGCEVHGRINLDFYNPVDDKCTVCEKTHSDFPTGAERPEKQEAVLARRF